MSIILLLAVMTVSVRATPSGLGLDEELNDEWNTYKAQYAKTYDGVTEIARRLIWEDNLKFIQQHNLEYDLGNHTYYLGVNEFSDMTHEEFKTRYTGAIMTSQNNSGSLFMAPENMPNLPNEVDWRKKGFVTEVKNQGACGSCWAFSTTGSLEGQYFRRKRKLINFSEQQLVDCSWNFGNHGCNGGLMNNAFDYVRRFGIESETDYPYKAVNSVCNYKSSKVVTSCYGHADIQRGNERLLAAAVASAGPVSVAIDASQRTFQHYKGGIYYDKRCSPVRLNHAVLVVGYGVEARNNYWMIKNSWGTQWGSRGYMKMAKDKRNNCGIATLASYPLI